jgi:hypothetical protein
MGDHEDGHGTADNNHDVRLIGGTSWAILVARHEWGRFC